MTDSTLDDLLRSVAEMAQPERRRDAARLLAREAGADDLLVFVRDRGIGRSLPALGFPQTLPGGRVWRELVQRAIDERSATGSVTAPSGEPAEAFATGLRDGSVMVLLGAKPRPRELEVLCTMLPLVGALFRVESAARHAEAESVLARQAAAQASELAAKLDIMRGDLQRAVIAAETATRARDEFLATVSHELRTPLTSMIGWVHLLRAQDDPVLVSEGLDTIERNARAQSRLIEDILDFSRINAGKLRLEVRPLELVDVIKAAVEVVRPAADARGVRLEAVLDPNTGIISGDPDRLQQVVWNLLSNAVKFTTRGGRVQLRLQRVNSHAELTVSDTGQGIAREFLPFVFDRFSQADSTSTRAHGGLGLGLGIVKHLVELHGGTVQAFSPGLGEGSSFVVRLPVIVAYPHAGAPVVQTEERDTLSDLTGVTLLVVEDNDDARLLLTTIFKRSHANVLAAPNVAAALKILEDTRPDLIISDIEMPGEDGYSLIRKVRLQESPSSRVPAIALTAYTRSVDRVRALAAGFQTHMAKPVEPAELVATVKSLLATVSR